MAAPGAPLTPRLQLLDAAGLPIATSTATNSGGTASLAAVAETAGTYYVIASSEDGDNGAYTLSLSGNLSPGPLFATAPSFAFADTPHQVRIQLSGDVGQSLSAQDLVVTRLPSGVPFSPASASFDALSFVATFYFAGPLSDGDYRARLPAGSVSDGSGNSLATDLTFDFFVLAGDANRDRRVDFDDLAILAQNYNTTGKSFAQGNFNYDPAGNVDFDDLALLAQRYNTSLPPMPAGAVAVAGQLPDDSTAERRRAVNPVFNATVPVQRKKPARPLERRA